MQFFQVYDYPPFRNHQFTCSKLSKNCKWWIMKTHICQHFFIIPAMTGSMSSGISRRRSWNPTAPTTCIGFIPSQGCCKVQSSHIMTPKLKTSHLNRKKRRNKEKNAWCHKKPKTCIHTKENLLLIWRFIP